MTENIKLTKKDFTSDQEVKWCPGCGDYAILSSTQMAMSKIGIPPHKVCVISGIGCSSRFPYYVNTFGMHSIHGRAPAIASGVKLQNPDLSVWIITGDGDSLSIGGNHFAHIIRRNLDVNILLFNNEIYGLTKGQYSPTSKTGIHTKSTPYGSLDRSFSPAQFAMGAGSTFFARTIDTDPKHMIETFQKAQEHKGTSVVEILQNCVIFNDKVHDEYTNRTTRDDHTVRLENGRPMVFGKEKDMALVQDGFGFKTEKFEGDIPANTVIHDEGSEGLSHLLAQLEGANGIVPLGVLRKLSIGDSYEESFHAQINAEKAKGSKTIKDLLHSGNTWRVE